MKEFGIPASAPELSCATDGFRFFLLRECAGVQLDRSGRCDFVSQLPGWSHTGRRRSGNWGAAGWARASGRRPTVESRPQGGPPGYSAAAPAVSQPGAAVARSAGSFGHGMPRYRPTGSGDRLSRPLFRCDRPIRTGGFESGVRAQRVISLLRHTRLIAVVLDPSRSCGILNGSLCAAQVLRRQADGLSAVRTPGGTVEPETACRELFSMANRRRTSRPSSRPASLNRDGEQRVCCMARRGDGIASAIRVTRS